MSRHHNPRASYDHRVTRSRFNDFDYFITWSYDRYRAHSRLRTIVGRSSTTDLRGARRFAKKWGLDMPDATS